MFPARLNSNNPEKKNVSTPEFILEHLIVNHSIHSYIVKKKYYKHRKILSYRNILQTIEEKYDTEIRVCMWIAKGVFPKLSEGIRKKNCLKETSLKCYKIFVLFYGSDHLFTDEEETLRNKNVELQKDDENTAEGARKMS